MPASGTSTAKKTAAKKTAASPDMDKVHQAQRDVGDHLEEQRQASIAQRDALAEFRASRPHAAVWDALAAPFPQSEIERLPKPVSRQDETKARCEQGSRASADGYYCGGWHTRSLHLSYVGHAGITTRLNTVVGPENWSWEPVAWTNEHIPHYNGGEFWIALTILGVTKYGVGDDFNRSGKQAIGDALRNAAMRFGVGTYLWSKSEAAQEMAAFTPPEDLGHSSVEQAAAAREPDPDAMTVWASVVNAQQVSTVREAWKSNEHLLERPIIHDGITERLSDGLRRLGDTLQAQQQQSNPA